MKLGCEERARIERGARGDADIGLERSLRERAPVVGAAIIIS